MDEKKKIKDGTSQKGITSVSGDVWHVDQIVRRDVLRERFLREIAPNAYSIIWNSSLQIECDMRNHPLDGRNGSGTV